MAAVNDFRVIRLSRPVKHDGGVVWAIRLRRPDGDAWRAIFGVFARAMTRDEQTRGTLSVLSGLPTEVFKKVRPDDFERLAAAVRIGGIGAALTTVGASALAMLNPLRLLRRGLALTTAAMRVLTGAVIGTGIGAVLVGIGLAGAWIYRKWPQRPEWLGGTGGSANPNAGPAGRLDGARRRGGPISAGGSYLVGEEEPEIVTPTRSGYVHPLSALARRLADAAPNTGVIEGGRIAEDAMHHVGAELGAAFRSLGVADNRPSGETTVHLAPLILDTPDVAVSADIQVDHSGAHRPAGPSVEMRTEASTLERETVERTEAIERVEDHSERVINDRQEVRTDHVEREDRQVERTEAIERVERVEGRPETGQAPRATRAQPMEVNISLGDFNVTVQGEQKDPRAIAWEMRDVFTREMRDALRGVMADTGMRTV